jgi:hypothetical protein
MGERERMSMDDFSEEQEEPRGEERRPEGVLAQLVRQTCFVPVPEDL